MRIFIKALVLTAVFFLALIGFKASVHVQDEAPKDDVELSNAEIARRVESTLRNAKYLEMTTVVFLNAPRDSKIDDPCLAHVKSFTIKAQMAPGALRALGYENGKDFVCAHSFYNGQCGEFQTCQPREEGKNPVRYPAPLSVGTNYPNLESPYNCVMGSQIFTWVGVPEKNDLPENVDMARNLRSRINDSVREKDQTVNGHDCYVFHQKDGALDQLICVDKETFLLESWVSIYPTYQKIRKFDIKIMDHVPKGTDWEIHPESIPLVLK